MLSLLAVVVSAPAMAATSLPYTETLGDVTTSGCDSQWDGDCETGWSGWGGTNTLELVTNATDSSVYGIKVTPGTSFWNGFWRDFTVTGGEVLEWKYDAIALDGGSADIAVRVVFKNASGATVDTKTHVESGFSDYGTVSSWFAVPTGVVTAHVFMGAKNPGSSGDEVVFADSSCFMDGCNGGWAGRELEDFYDNGCNNTCPECDISCPSGTLVNTCYVDEDCQVHEGECFCEDSEEEYQSSNDWN